MKTACRKAFTETILELAKEDQNIVVLTSDARGSVTLGDFAQQLSDQFVEIGIAEQNLVGTAAGLALNGLKPFVCSPACFLSARSFEQIKVDMAYADTNVKAIGVSGGVSYGALGTSHHSLQDIAMMRATAGITVILPCDARQTIAMTKKLVNHIGPVYVRMGRGAVDDVYEADDCPFEIGQANMLHEGYDITIIGCGETVRIALDAAIELESQGISARVLDMHTLKPFDEESVLKAAKETGRIITIEEHCAKGGLGGAVAEILAQKTQTPLKIIGIPDEQTMSGESPEVFKHYGLTAENVIQSAKDIMGK